MGCSNSKAIDAGGGGPINGSTNNKNFNNNIKSNDNAALTNRDMSSSSNNMNNKTASVVAANIVDGMDDFNKDYKVLKKISNNTANEKGKKKKKSSVSSIYMVTPRSSRPVRSSLPTKTNDMLLLMQCIDLNSVAHERRKQMRHEVQALKRIRHDNILQVLDVYQTTDTVILVTELCLGGDLSTRLNSVGGTKPIAEHRANQIISQILDAVLYLESKGISNHSLSTENSTSA